VRRLPVLAKQWHGSSTIAEIRLFFLEQNKEIEPRTFHL
jgi:hypothetical protein